MTVATLSFEETDQNDPRPRRTWVIDDTDDPKYQPDEAAPMTLSDTYQYEGDHELTIEIHDIESGEKVSGVFNPKEVAALLKVCQSFLYSVAIETAGIKRDP